MWQYVTCAARRRDDRRRRRAAHPAALPLRAARLLPRRRRLPRRDQRDPARRPTRRPSCAAIERAPGHQVLRPADGVDRAAAPPRLRRRGPVVAAQGLLRRVADAGRGAQGDPASGCPTSTSGTSTGRPRWRRWPRSSARTSSSRTPARPAGPRSTSRPGSSTTQDQPVPGRRRSARSCTARRTRRSATTDDDDKTAEAFRRRLVPLRRPRLRRRDGRLYVVDRKKDMIKTGGENVASREVEEAIYAARRRRRGRRLRRLPPALGRGGHRGRRARSRARRSPPTTVIAHARSVLAGYKAPKYVVVADALPKNPSGKILKRQLRDEHADIAAE